MGKKKTVQGKGRQTSGAQTADVPSVASVAQRVFVVRGYNVLLDADLAEMYEVETRRLNEQVRRNQDRFPGDFAFQLTAEEFAALMSQTATSKSGRGGRRKLPWVFTEQGVAMLSSVLRSPRAVSVNIAIMRAFVRLRELLASPGKLAGELQRLIGRVDRHDAELQAVFRILDRLTAEPKKSPARIGFHVGRKK